MSAKRRSEFFYFADILSYLKKCKKLVCRNQIIFIFTNTSRTKQNKKNPEHPFVEIGK